MAFTLRFLKGGRRGGGLEGVAANEIRNSDKSGKKQVAIEVLRKKCSLPLNKKKKKTQMTSYLREIYDGRKHDKNRFGSGDF